jgi:transitional endoplasmic reticulum ATPase
MLGHAEIGHGQLRVGLGIFWVSREEEMEFCDCIIVSMMLAKSPGFRNRCHCRSKMGTGGGLGETGMIKSVISALVPDQECALLYLMNLESLKAALAASPDNIPLLLMVAEALEDEFELGEARETLNRILELDSDHTGAQVAIARILDLEGRLSEAIIRVESICQAHSDCGEAWFLRARLTLKEGEAREARGYYETAIESDPALADGAFLEMLISSGATSAKEGKRAMMTANGEFIEEEDLEDELTGMQAVAAHELEMEFKVKNDCKFEDVGGMEEVKNDISMKIIHPLKNPEIFAAYGKKAGGGVLMYGPPGCGKTLLSQATAGEISANFFSVGLHQVLDMYIGGSENRLHQIFELARQCAPSVLFFDEIDALAADRRELKGSAGRTLINQFLAELDGSQNDNEGVLILGATNAPWHLDGAFLRPGRFDRMIFVPPPDQVAREEIVRIHAKDKPVVALDEAALAKRCEGFSGADIMAVFSRATESKMEEAMKKGKIIPVTGKDLVKSAKLVKPSTRKWFESAKNYALYANQSGFYDDVLIHMGIKK